MLTQLLVNNSLYTNFTLGQAHSSNVWVIKVGNFHIFDGALIVEGRLSEGALISKFSKAGIQIFHLCSKIKYHTSIFEKYRTFNIDERI